MVKKQITIISETGVHERLGTMFIRKASSYKSEILIVKGHATISAKSIMGFFSLGLSEGDVIELQAIGEDEELAVEELSRYILELK